MKTKLLALCLKLGIVADESMTIDAINALIEAYQPVVATVATQQDALPPKTADVIFKALNSSNMHEFSGYKVMFIAGSKYGLRLILRKGDATVAVYVYEESVKFSGVKHGDVVTILAEQTMKNGKSYWNATALSVE